MPRRSALAALLRDDLGRLVPGAKADIRCSICPRGPRQVIDPIQTMMIAGRAGTFRPSSSTPFRDAGRRHSALIRPATGHARGRSSTAWSRNIRN